MFNRMPIDLKAGMLTRGFKMGNAEIEPPYPFYRHCRYRADYRAGRQPYLWRQPPLTVMTKCWRRLSPKSYNKQFQNRR